MIFSHVLYQLSYLAYRNCRVDRRADAGLWQKTEYNTQVFAGTLVETATREVMPAHVDSFPLHHRDVRRLLKPMLGWAFLATILTIIRRLTHEPSLPRMSEQWLLSHQMDFSRDSY